MGKVKKKHLELVGLLVVHARTVGKYHIDYLYKIDIDGELTGRAIQKGFDWALHLPFWEIVLALGDAYAPVLDKRWTRRTDVAVEVLLSFKRGQTPSSVGMGCDWVLDCER